MDGTAGSFDLLNPSPQLQGHYIHQLRTTIQAYSATQVVIGEVLQNAIDAVVTAGGTQTKITIDINFDTRTIKVRDNDTGFPNDPKLLFLGGTLKKNLGNKKIFGLVGVGLKVVLFSSEFFRIRALAPDGNSFSYEVADAYKFDQDPPPTLMVPASFSVDPQPLDSPGTEIEYRFPEGAPRDFIGDFVHELLSRCLPNGKDKDFGEVLTHAVEKNVFENRFAGLLASFMRRYTYSADVLNRLGSKQELRGTTLTVSFTCSDPQTTLPEVADLFDSKTTAKVIVEPSYLLVEDVRAWVPVQAKPGLFQNELGHGGTNLSRTFNGFNTRTYSSPEDYEKLLVNKQGKITGDIEEYKSDLFPRINGIILTIGRIPSFEQYLPGGSRRVLSANGVVTSHELDLTKGRNQEYVRCFDIVIDVDAVLNYGKTQLTDNHLVGRVRRFLNDAYAATIQNAAGNWVGRIDPPDATEERDVFLARPDLGLADFMLQKAPRDENDVIALFFELAGKGHLPGYKIYGLSQRDQYDSRGAIRRSGDNADPQTPEDDRRALTVEFKVDAAMVITDFEREAKNAREVHLLIAWDEGASGSQQYGFADIRHSVYSPDKIFPGVRRYLVDTKSGAQVQVLLLKPLVDNLKAGNPAIDPPAAAPKAAPKRGPKGKK